MRDVVRSFFSFVLLLLFVLVALPAVIFGGAVDFLVGEGIYSDENVREMREVLVDYSVEQLSEVEGILGFDKEVLRGVVEEKFDEEFVRDSVRTLWQKVLAGRGEELSLQGFHDRVGEVVLEMGGLYVKALPKCEVGEELEDGVLPKCRSLELDGEDVAAFMKRRAYQSGIGEIPEVLELNMEVVSGDTLKSFRGLVWAVVGLLFLVVLFSRYPRVGSMLRFGALGLLLVGVGVYGLLFGGSVFLSGFWAEDAGEEIYLFRLARILLDNFGGLVGNYAFWFLLGGGILFLISLFIRKNSEHVDAY